MFKAFVSSNRRTKRIMIVRICDHSFVFDIENSITERGVYYGHYRSRDSDSLRSISDDSWEALLFKLKLAAIDSGCDTSLLDLEVDSFGNGLDLFGSSMPNLLVNTLLNQKEDYKYEA